MSQCTFTTDLSPHSMDVQMNPSKLALLYRGLFECFPQWIVEYAKYTPARAYRKAKRINEMFEEIGRDLYHSNADEEKADRDGKRDVMSVLSTSTFSVTCSKPHDSEMR